MKALMGEELVNENPISLKNSVVFFSREYFNWHRLSFHYSKTTTCQVMEVGTEDNEGEWKS